MIVMGTLGYFRGALRMLASLLALFVGGLLAFPLGGVGGAVLRATGLVPRSLLGPIGMLFTGIVVFIVLMIPIEIALRKREASFKEDSTDTRGSWDRFGGAVLGLIWGLILAVIVLAGIATIGQAQRAVRYANAELDFRAERRRTETLRVNKIARITHQQAKPISYEIELADVEDKDLKPAPPSKAEEMTEEIEASFFSPMVRKAEPIDYKSERVLRDLSVTVGDPCLMERFQDHPKVRELGSNPKIQELARDPEIAAAIREGRYRDLLDNEKLAAVAGDKELAAKLKDLNIKQLLKEIKSPDYAPLKGLRNS